MKRYCVLSHLWKSIGNLHPRPDHETMAVVGDSAGENMAIAMTLIAARLNMERFSTSSNMLEHQLSHLSLMPRTREPFKELAAAFRHTCRQLYGQIVRCTVTTPGTNWSPRWSILRAGCGMAVAGEPTGQVARIYNGQEEKRMWKTQKTIDTAFPVLYTDKRKLIFGMVIVYTS